MLLVWKIGHEDWCMWPEFSIPQWQMLACYLQLHMLFLVWKIGYSGFDGVRVDWVACRQGMDHGDRRRSGSQSWRSLPTGFVCCTRRLSTHKARRQRHHPPGSSIGSHHGLRTSRSEGSFFRKERRSITIWLNGISSCTRKFSTISTILKCTRSSPRRYSCSPPSLLWLTLSSFDLFPSQNVKLRISS